MFGLVRSNGLGSRRGRVMGVRRVFILTGLLPVLLLPAGANAHQGGLDANGGHHCRQAGFSSGLCSPLNSYHCHKAGCVDRDGAVGNTSGAAGSSGDGSVSDGPRVPRAPRQPAIPRQPGEARSDPTQVLDKSDDKSLPETGAQVVTVGLAGASLLGAGSGLVGVSKRMTRRGASRRRDELESCPPIQSSDASSDLVWPYGW